MTEPAGPDGAVVLRAPRQIALERAQDGRGQGRAGGAGGDMAVFTLTTFLSALLLFSIQPMFAKMVLPVLGGSTSVWAVAMVFFQGALLAGYAYAHMLTRLVPARATGFVHLGLYVLAAIVLPIAIPASWGEPPPGEPYLWQLGLFTVAVGLPFVAVAANAPLLQAWFARTGHADAKDPYFLYAASNLGSLIALLVLSARARAAVRPPGAERRVVDRLRTSGAGVGAVLLAGAPCCSLCGRARRRRCHAVRGGASRWDAPDPTWIDRLGWVRAGAGAVGAADGLSRRT